MKLVNTVLETFNPPPLETLTFGNKAMRILIVTGSLIVAAVTLAILGATLIEANATINNLLNSTTE